MFYRKRNLYYNPLHRSINPRLRVRKAGPVKKSRCDLIDVIFADIKKPPVGYPMEADAVVALRPHFLSEYHLAQLQVGGASALS